MTSQSKFLKRAMKIIDNNLSVFKALEDFEKTGKTITKTRLNFTVDREIAKRFRDYCKKHNLNMSEMIEDYIKNKK